MDREKGNFSSVSVPTAAKSDMPENLEDCCKRTIKLLSGNNPMMVCDECKKMIKVFSNESEFRNYVKFCESRHRSILTCKFNDLLVVVYQAYTAYGR